MTTDTKRLNMLSIDPRDLIILGIDVPDDPKDPLHDPERINLTINPNMVKNIKVNGVIETIVAQKRGESYYVVNGRQRVRHARIAADELEKEGLERLRCKVITTTGDNKSLISKKESANRFRVNDDIATSARAAARYVDQGISEDDIAAMMDVSGQTIRNWLSYLTLAPEVQASVFAGELTATAALQLAPLPQEQQVEVVEELKQEQKDTGVKPTAERAKKKVAAATNKTVGITPKERIEKATLILTKAAGLTGKEQTKEALMEVLQKLSRTIAGKAFDKLGDEE